MENLGNVSENSGVVWEPMKRRHAKDSIDGVVEWQGLIQV